MKSITVCFLVFIITEQLLLSCSLIIDSLYFISIKTSKLENAMIFQDYGLFPWMTAGENICITLKQKFPKWDKTKRSGFRIDALLMLMDEPFGALDAVTKALLQDTVNVSTFDICSGETETVRKLSFNAMKQGVDILAPACGLSTKTHLVNVQAMVESFENFR